MAYSYYFVPRSAFFFLLKNITKCTHVASINRNSKRSLSTETCSYFIFYLINFILVFHRAFVELYKCFRAILVCLICNVQHHER